MKIRKTFLYEGIELKIAEVEEPYLNTNMSLTRVVAPNGKRLPLSFSHRATLKLIMFLAIEQLDGFKKRGADIKKELTE